MPRKTTATTVGSVLPPAGQRVSGDVLAQARVAGSKAARLSEPCVKIGTVGHLGKIIIDK